MESAAQRVELRAARLHAIVSLQQEIRGLEQRLLHGARILNGVAVSGSGGGAGGALDGDADGAAAAGSISAAAAGVGGVPAAGRSFSLNLASRSFTGKAKMGLGSSMTGAATAAAADMSPSPSPARRWVSSRAYVPKNTRQTPSKPGRGGGAGGGGGGASGGGGVGGKDGFDVSSPGPRGPAGTSAVASGAGGGVGSPALASASALAAAAAARGSSSFLALTSPSVALDPLSIALSGSLPGVSSSPGHAVRKQLASRVMTVVLGSDRSHSKHGRRIAWSSGFPLTPRSEASVGPKAVGSVGSDHGGSAVGEGVPSGAAAGGGRARAGTATSTGASPSQRNPLRTPSANAVGRKGRGAQHTSRSPSRRSRPRCSSAESPTAGDVGDGRFRAGSASPAGRSSDVPLSARPTALPNDIATRDLRRAIADLRAEYTTLTETYKRRVAAVSAEERRDAVAAKWIEVQEQSRAIVHRLNKERERLNDRLQAAASEVGGCIAAEHTSNIAHTSIVSGLKREIVQLTSRIDAIAAAVFKRATVGMHRLRVVASAAEANERCAMYAADVESSLYSTYTAMQEELEERLGALRTLNVQLQALREEDSALERVRACAGGGSAPMYSISSTITALEMQRKILLS